jgi:hypothetical protein
LINTIYVIKFILILAFAWFLYKKTVHHEMLKRFLMFSGSLFFSAFVIAVAWAIIEGFFLE